MNEKKRLYWQMKNGYATDGGEYQNEEMKNKPYGGE